LFTLGSFSENYKSSPQFLDYFFHDYGCALILAKMDWAAFWAIFFTNSSGHFGKVPPLECNTRGKRLHPRF
jgi:hypothetical protein